jgi:hypothetical protein
MLIKSHMVTFAMTLLITFMVIVAAILWLSYCKRHQRHGKHGLTGMCHESGGTVCSSCAGTAAALSERGCHGKGDGGTAPAVAAGRAGGYLGQGGKEGEV